MRELNNAEMCSTAVSGGFLGSMIVSGACMAIGGAAAAQLSDSLLFIPLGIAGVVVGHEIGSMINSANEALAHYNDRSEKKR